MNKLLSKKNGFTLVEILVAFAIFAIMASMVMAIVQLAIRERSSINELAKEIAVQEEDLVRMDKIQEYDETDSTLPTGTFSFAFQNEAGEDKGTATIDYQMHTTDDSKNTGNLYNGVNYFIGDVEYKDVTTDDPDKNSGSLAAQYDTRITGTKGFMYVKMVNVKKDETYTGTGVRYLFETAVIPDTTDSISLKFAQYKLYFKDTTSSTTLTTTRDDGEEYTYQRPDTAKIISAGYVNSTSLNPAKCSEKREESTNAYKITLLRYATSENFYGAIQIGYDYANGGNRDFSKNTGFSRFYVIFDSDPHLDVDDFGSNGVKSGSSYEYKTFVDADGETIPNIYGAYDFVYTKVS